MRIIFLVFISLLIEACNEDSSRDRMLKEDTIQHKDVFENKTSDSLRLQELFGFNDENTSALIIQRDTVFFLTPYHWEKSKYEFLKVFYYDSVNRVFHYNSNVRENTKNLNFINLDSFLNKPQVYLRQVRKPGISYPTLPEKLKRNPKIKSLLRESVKIQKYNSDYYFINVMSPKEINVYNSSNDEMKSFLLKHLILHVTDFFLYDVDKEGNPEMFIFHIGMVPRHEIISYSIVSLRKDSIKVYFK